MTHEESLLRSAGGIAYSSSWIVAHSWIGLLFVGYTVKVPRSEESQRGGEGFQGSGVHQGTYYYQTLLVPASGRIYGYHNN